MKKFIVSNYQRIKRLYAKYERVLMPATLVGGFLLDYFTFTSIQISTTFILLFAYWVLAGAVITFSHVYDAGRLPQKNALRYARLFAPLAVQFAFGSLLGSSLIFYWFSGAFSVSWPLMIIIVLLLVFNDAFRHHFEKPLVQISVYFFATFSLLSVLLPFLFSSLSAWLFVAAGAISLVIFLAYVYYLLIFANHLQAQKKRLFLLLFIIAGAMNALYFTNIIPPIPLALREAGVYHSLKRSGAQYIMGAENENFLRAALFGQKVHVAPGEKTFVYTSIFAPAQLKTTIVHHWLYYDEAKKDWVDKGDLKFTINGGRKEGYKGYSYQSNLAAGKWRVYVENQRGQVLGRVIFTVEKVDAPVALQEIVR